jgi:hypothetical protein
VKAKLGARSVDSVPYPHGSCNFLTPVRGCRREHAIHLGPVDPGLVKERQHWRAPLDDGPPSPIGGRRVCIQRLPAAAHWPCSGQDQNSLPDWTSTQQTAAPGEPLGHQNIRQVWHSPVCDSRLPETGGHRPRLLNLLFPFPSLVK